MLGERGTSKRRHPPYIVAAIEFTSLRDRTVFSHASFQALTP
jgi:hypothetical protein